MSPLAHPTAGSFKGYTPDADARRKIGEASRNRPTESKLKFRLTTRERVGQ